jgi:hypothetical protein
MAAEPEQGIELADAIAMLRAEVLKAHEAGANSPVQFPVDSLVVELQVAATRSVDGKAGFCVPFVNVELGGGAGWQREKTQTVTITFGGPVDGDGNPVKVARASNQIKG